MADIDDLIAELRWTAETAKHLPITHLLTKAADALEQEQARADGMTVAYEHGYCEDSIAHSERLSRRLVDAESAYGDLRIMLAERAFTAPDATDYELLDSLDARILAAQTAAAGHDAAKAEVERLRDEAARLARAHLRAGAAVGAARALADRLDGQYPVAAHDLRAALDGAQP